eukprot:TRINITY_DN18410_c0_g1_i1.p1 TRINITY_DN18410_c0_g1~~TRINITY_DN18410_c0_g1_i1.p1  ORF type:complete len:440 (+),score=71.93 TRINITY_DN18410_c0_g1_i1:112-1431(+)
MTQMHKDVEARIRALPGNKLCMDCNNLNPQWASVTYGALMCLECAGHHRALGVHLSFIRSVAMDAWKEREIAAMERSGGNDKLVNFFTSKGIDKDMHISKKYNTKQAAYYRDRLSRWLDGKTEPPPDPGNYDPVSGGDAQGAEPLPGETAEAYNARQARLREVARERLREKFGNGGMNGMGAGGSVMTGIGSDPNPCNEGGDGILAALGGFGSFIKQNVIENETVRGAVGGAVGGVGTLAGGAVGVITRAATEGDVLGSLKRNATAEDGSVVKGAIGWVGSAIRTARNGDTIGGSREGGYGARNSQAPEDEDDEAFFASIGARKSDVGEKTRETTSEKQTDSASVNFKSDDWGEWGEGNKPVRTEVANDCRRDLQPAPSNGTSIIGANRERAMTVPTPQKLDRARTAPDPATQHSAIQPEKRAPAKLSEADDFFSSFGV